jgi:hypothetical protein
LTGPRTVTKSRRHKYASVDRQRVGGINVHAELPKIIALAVSENVDTSPDGREPLLRLLGSKVEHQLGHLGRDLSAHDLAWRNKTNLEGQERSSVDLNTREMRELKWLVSGALEVLGDGDFGWRVSGLELHAGSAGRRDL